jgi:hypothetical protein
MRALLAVLALTACGPDPAEPSDTTTDEIIDGWEDGWREGVVAIATGDTPLCTGTIIGERAVLTAAHCGIRIQAGRETVVLGPRIAGGPRLAIDHVVNHPGYDASRVRGDDVAVVILRDRAPSWIAVPLAGPDFLGEGTSVTISGFGVAARDDWASAGVRRSTTADVSALSENDFDTRGGWFSSGGMACYGDSGGPALLTIGGVEHVAGVAGGTDRWCSWVTGWLRVASYRAFIEGATGGGSAPPGGCGGLDYFGTCDASGVLSWCRDGQTLVTRDCAAEGLRCAWYSDDVGFDCW